MTTFFPTGAVISYTWSALETVPIRSSLWWGLLGAWKDVGIFSFELDTCITIIVSSLHWMLWQWTCSCLFQVPHWPVVLLVIALHLLLAQEHRLSTEIPEAEQRADLGSVHRVPLPSFIISSIYGCRGDGERLDHRLACIVTRACSCSLGSFQA